MNEPDNRNDASGDVAADSGPRKTGISRKVALAAALAVPAAAALGWLWTTIKDASQLDDQAEEKGAQYDLSKLPAIDPGLIKYEQVTQIDTGMQSPKALAFDAKGHLLIVGDKLLRILDGHAEYGRITLPEEPMAVAPAADSSILVAFRQYIQRYSAAGSLQATWPKFGDKSNLTGLAMHGSEVLVADSGQRLVFRCDADGKILGEIGRKDEARGVDGLVLPSPYLTVARNASGEILVSNPGRHRIETYSADGEIRGFFGQSGDGIDQFLGCCNPACFALLSDGRIVTVEKGLPRIKIFRAVQGQWKLDSYVAEPKTLGQNHLGFKIAIDSSDRVLVLEPANSNIRVFAPISASASTPPGGKAL